MVPFGPSAGVGIGLPARLHCRLGEKPAFMVTCLLTGISQAYMSYSRYSSFLSETGNKDKTESVCRLHLTLLLSLYWYCIEEKEAAVEHIPNHTSRAGQRTFILTMSGFSIGYQGDRLKRHVSKTCHLRILTF